MTRTRRRMLYGLCTRHRFLCACRCSFFACQATRLFLSPNNNCRLHGIVFFILSITNLLYDGTIINYPPFLRPRFSRLAHMVASGTGLPVPLVAVMTIPQSDGQDSYRTISLPAKLAVLSIGGHLNQIQPSQATMVVRREGNANCFSKQLRGMRKGSKLLMNGS